MKSANDAVYGNTIAARINAFNASLAFEDPLPEGIRAMNPFQESPSALAASSAFYAKYYNDPAPRRMILGINPGRFGAGLTGVPFTDPKRLVECCGITMYEGPMAHEPSSVFIYEMIKAYGGPETFYRDWYINSICPLGFVREGANGKEVNYNYYDSKELTLAVRDFAVRSIRKQLEFCLNDFCVCLGTGKNEKFLRELNEEYAFFTRIAAVEHPRYVIQYKTKHMDEYIRKYIDTFRS